MSKCLGCGITLQDTDKNSLGYTPKLSNTYCERCFKTIHYNKEIKVDNIDNDKIIKKINKLNLFTLYLTDFLSLNNNVINNFKQITNHKILVINKCDIIPINLKLEHLEENIKKIYNISDEVIFISAKNNLYLNYLKNLINYYKEVIFCGETSSGKSTLINNLIGTNLTTSKYQNTTLDFIKIKRDDYVIYDTPGLNILNRDNYDKIKVITKSLSNDYVLEVDDLKIKGTGNITLFISDKSVIKSKKEDLKLDYVIKIDNPTDLLFKNGFIFLKDNNININKDLERRNSIIK